MAAVKSAVVGLVFATAFFLASAECTAAKLGERMLAPGSWGEDVFELQMRLHDQGYAVTADGRFGDKTTQAVKAFQRKAGLPVDGLVGKDTAFRIVARYGVTEHRVKIGETVAGIAKHFGVDANMITRFNSVDPLKVGQLLIIPTAPKYQVRSGDTLRSLAGRFQTSTAELQRLNNLRDSASLQVGMWLRLPNPEY